MGTKVTEDLRRKTNGTPVSRDLRTTPETTGEMVNRFLQSDPIGYLASGIGSFFEDQGHFYGSRPEDADILNRVTELFRFDPSVGAGEVQDMIGGYRSELTSFLPSVQQYGVGFEGFGGRQKAMQTERTGAYSEIDRASTDIASSEQDRQMAELIAYLTQLETQGGVKFT